jgi:ferredoxin--NADP+ reductase
MDKYHNPFLVAVIGAGPAGMYAAQYLAKRGVEVALFNRDIKPGGLVEYGIFPSKTKLRGGLLAYFQRILKSPGVHYFGNVRVGQSGDIRLDQLRRAGFDAILVTTGAQQNYWLGLPGEDLEGVYHANDLVFHYNRLPQFSRQSIDIGQKVVVIGVGNVTMDILHYLKTQNKERVVTAYARRGPTEVKFDKETLEPVAGCLDCDYIEQSVKDVLPIVEAAGSDVMEYFSLLRQSRENASECNTGLTFRMAFLRSPRRILGDEHGHAAGVVFEINELVRDGEKVLSRGTGVFETIPADTVIFSIGSRVDSHFGLPVEHGNYVTNPHPRFPVDGISYEVYNPDLCAGCEDVFVSGWARKASEGIVGLARKDAERGAKAVLAYLSTLEPSVQKSVNHAIENLPLNYEKVIGIKELNQINQAEQALALEKDEPGFKFESNEEMLRVIKRA